MRSTDIRQFVVIMGLSGLNGMTGVVIQPLTSAAQPEVNKLVTINLEGVVEADIDQHFDSYIGGGVHICF